MTIYINKKTGAEIKSPFPLGGDNWVVKSEVSKENKKAEKIENKSVKDNSSKKESSLKKKDLNVITKKDIINELKAFGIEFNPNLTKKELIKLL